MSAILSRPQCVKKVPENAKHPKNHFNEHSFSYVERGYV